MAIQAFGLSLEPSMCRLYIDDDSDAANIPCMLDRIFLKILFLNLFLILLVYDHQIVDAIDFKQNNTNLCLKLGEALKENDILLYISSEREPSPLELVVDFTITLNELWNLIKQELHMDSKELIEEI